MSDPGFEEIRRNVYWIKGNKTSNGCRVYLLRGSRKNALVDTGVPADAETIRASLASLGLAPEDIHLVLLTHEHIDHIGGVPFLPRGALVAAHVHAASKIRAQDEFVLWNKAYGITPEQFPVDLLLEHDTVIDLGDLALRVVKTPGHVSGAVCYHELQNHLLFTGDTLFAGGVLGGIYPSGNISDYLASLRRLCELRIEEVCPGHGRTSRTPYPDLETAIRRSESLIQETKALFNAVDSRGTFKHIRQAVVSYAKRD
jgi:glyoxylase-like metal-dependent hydrolase (beta-lactamase superfamily II)